MFLHTTDWLNLFGELLKSLDRLCKLWPDCAALDLDDISWPGVVQMRQNHICHKFHDDLPLINKADLENHNEDGGLWVVVNNKVYDVQDIR